MLEAQSRFISICRSGGSLASFLSCVLLATVSLGASLPDAPNSPNLVGDYSGSLGGLHLKLHVKAGDGGALSGSLDSPDQGANGIPCTDFHVSGREFSFVVPSVHGSWKGTASVDGKTLSGTWDQGSPMPLDFSRDEASDGKPAFVAAEKPSAVDGIWLGELSVGGATLRVQVQVKSDHAGKEYCSLDSLDQNAMGLECANVSFSADDFSFEVPAVHGSWKGKLSADGKSLTGTWTQGSPLPLNFTLQSTALAAKPVAPPKYDAATPPVDAAGLQALLDGDLAESLKSGELAPATGAGVTIAVVKHGVRRVFSYGVAKPDSIFEIGSISKTFTGLILAQMVVQGKVKLDEPVRELLPAGTVAKPAGAEITLVDLATQHSGLPRMPEDFAPKDNDNPYADYLPASLYAYIGKHGVAKPADAGFLYSNLGFGLLGQALADRAGVAYSELLKKEVTGPLGLKDTTVSLSAEQQARFIPGHDGDHLPAHAWDLVAFAGAGAIRSTASDMLAYLEANLHPEAIRTVTSQPESATLPAAFKLDHELRSDAMPGMRIALAWLHESASGNTWHNGATGGYSSYAFFNPEGDYAAVVLLNTSIGKAGSFADRLGQHISQRLAGKPAISLAP